MSRLSTNVAAEFGREMADVESLGAKVMIVDDESMTSRLLQVFLEDVGYSRFVTTNRSTEALGILLAERPDVLLLDIHMPEMDGFELLEQLRANDKLKHIPVLILTAADDAANKLRALELGATDFLAKPVDTSELALRLRNTLAAKAYQDRLTYYDGLTDLPNRRMFLDRFEDSLAEALRRRSMGAVLHIDLDRFRHMNDSVGHGAGDRLLRIVGGRIARCVRESDEVCRAHVDGGHASASRFGGDEFMVLLPSVESRNSVTMVARRIIDAVAQPIPWNEGELVITPSIGLLEFPVQADSVETLLRNVALATAQAKALGRNRYNFFSESCEAQSTDWISFEADLHQALSRDELRLHYQPKVEIRTGRVSGAEALLRWEHPTRGLVPPNQFIPLAEETGLIVPFGAWVLQTACRQLAEWSDLGRDDLSVAVNVASLQLSEGHLLEVVRDALQQASVNPSRLTLELTESATIEHARENIDTLTAIRALGVRLSLDDFGTGYSSLSYLEQLPIDELKIDRSFVKRIDKDGDDAPILNAVITMAQVLGFQVVAEGVEKTAQLEYLRRHGCDLFQGYLYSKPLPADQFNRKLEEGMAEPRATLAGV